MGKSGHRLLPQHRKLIKASAISKGVAEARGYRSHESSTALRRLGFSPRQEKLVPALGIPIWDVFGRNDRYQIRPDEPEPDPQSGRLQKYENQPRVGVTLDVNPTVRKKVLNVRHALFITEGVRKGDSLASVGQACVALYGVWNWRGTDESGAVVALADWDQIPLKSRLVYVVFDSDVMQKRSVKLALERIGKFLVRRGAEVQYVYLPPTEGGEKQGVDDFLAAENTVDDLLDYAEERVRGLPEVILNASQMRDVSRTVLTTLELANDPPRVHRWAGTLARVKVDEQGRPVTEPYDKDALRNQMSLVADYYQAHKDQLVDRYPPRELAADILALHEWPFPTLHAVVESPTLRPDGSILDQPGYDPSTGIVYVPSVDLDMPEIPAKPSPKSVGRARRLLRELIQDFPFVDAADRTNMLALLLTPVVRPAIAGPVPLALLDAPSAGTGKSLLAEDRRR